MSRNRSFLLMLVLLPWLAAAAPDAPQRIASGSLASDEILVELLGAQGQLNRLIAVSQFATDPRYSNVVSQIPPGLTGRVGGELESLVALKPDLAILASYNKPEMVTRLEAAKIKVLRLTEFRNLDDIEHNITTLGDVAGTQAEAQNMRTSFRAERQKIRELAAKMKVHPKVLDFSEDNTVSGAGTLFDDMVKEAGGTGLAAANGLKNWPKIGTEALAILRPDVIVTSGDPAKKNEYLAQMRGLAGWKDMPAVKAGRVIVIPGNELAAVSPHVLKALKKLQAGFVE